MSRMTAAVSNDCQTLLQFAFAEDLGVSTQQGRVVLVCSCSDQHWMHISDLEPEGWRLRF